MFKPMLKETADMNTQTTQYTYLGHIQSLVDHVSFTRKQTTLAKEVMKNQRRLVMLEQELPVELLDYLSE
jgi:hypothetical protein